jgi:hypothetical protein
MIPLLWTSAEMAYRRRDTDLHTPNIPGQTCRRALFAVSPQLKDARKGHIMLDAAGRKGWLHAFHIVSGGEGVSTGSCNLA